MSKNSLQTPKLSMSRHKGIQKSYDIYIYIYSYESKTGEQCENLVKKLMIFVQKAKDSTKDCKKILINTFFKRNCQKEKAISKKQDSIKSYNKRKKCWINTLFKGVCKLRTCPAQKTKDSTKDCKKFQTNTFFERNCQKEKTISKKQRFYQKLQQA